jgi:hypothetical protein
LARRTALCPSCAEDSTAPQIPFGRAERTADRFPGPHLAIDADPRAYLARTRNEEVGRGPSVPDRSAGSGNDGHPRAVPCNGISHRPANPVDRMLLAARTIPCRPNRPSPPPPHCGACRQYVHPSTRESFTNAAGTTRNDRSRVVGRRATGLTRGRHFYNIRNVEMKVELIAPAQGDRLKGFRLRVGYAPERLPAGTTAGCCTPAGVEAGSRAAGVSMPKAKGDAPSPGCPPAAAPVTIHCRSRP